MGARESDVPPVAEMVTGGNTSHYWNDGGSIGNLFQHALDIKVYAWDVWMIYKPGVQWNEEYPPAPDYWMHNLWGVEDIPRLDSGVFAGTAEKYIKEIQDSRN